MFRLIKWLAIGTVTVGAVGYFLFGGHAMSYVKTAANSIREGITGSIPVSVELERAELLIQEIDPQIEDGKRQVAEAAVNLKHLNDEIVVLEQKVAHTEKKLRTRSAALAGYQLAAGIRERTEIDLERTLSVHKNNVELLKGKRALVERHTRAVTAAAERLDAIRTEKARLVDMVASLKAQKKHLDSIAVSSCDIDFDDTALGQAREVLDKVKHRLEVAEKMIQDDIFFESRPDEAPSSKNIVAEIEAYFAEEDLNRVGEKTLTEVR